MGECTLHKDIVLSHITFPSNVLFYFSYLWNIHQLSWVFNSLNSYHILIQVISTRSNLLMNNKCQNPCYNYVVPFFTFLFFLTLFPLEKKNVKWCKWTYVRPYDVWLNQRVWNETLVFIESYQLFVAISDILWWCSLVLRQPMPSAATFTSLPSTVLCSLWVWDSFGLYTCLSSLFFVVFSFVCLPCLVV